MRPHLSCFFPIVALLAAGSPALADEVGACPNQVTTCSGSFIAIPMTVAFELR